MFIGAAKAGQPQALAALAAQLEGRMHMSGDDVMARLSGGRVPKRKRAEDQRLVDDLNFQSRRRITRAAVMVAANQPTGEPGVACRHWCKAAWAQGTGELSYVIELQAALGGNNRNRWRLSRCDNPVSA